MKTLPLRETSRASGCAQTHACTHRHTNTQTHRHTNTHRVFSSAVAVSMRPRMHSVMETFLSCIISSWRRELKNPSSANFVAEYEVVKGVGIFPGGKKRE